MAASDDSRPNPIFKLIGDTYELIFVKKKKITSWVSFFLILGLTFLVFNAEAKEKAGEMLGRPEILDILGGTGPGEGYNSKELKDRIEVQDIISKSGDLQEGTADSTTLPNDIDRIVSHISLDLTWEDESDKPGLPRLRSYENLPDLFKVTLLSPNGTEIEVLESNSERISFDISISEYDMLVGIEEGPYTVEVELISAGDWETARGPSLITYTDDSNAYDLVVEMTYLEVEEEQN